MHACDLESILSHTTKAAPTPPSPCAQYENPIQRGRDADASEAQVTKGLEAMGDLMSLINNFMLRRTSTVLKKLLPAKVEQVGGGGARSACCCWCAFGRTGGRAQMEAPPE